LQCKTCAGDWQVFLRAWLRTAFGAFRVIVVAAVLYALGMVAMAHADTVSLFVLSAGVMIGVAQAGGSLRRAVWRHRRNVPAERRSWAMGQRSCSRAGGVHCSNTLMVFGCTFQLHILLDNHRSLEKTNTLNRYHKDYITTVSDGEKSPLKSERRVRSYDHFRYTSKLLAPVSYIVQ
jgi:hypothetical protein